MDTILYYKDGRERYFHISEVRGILTNYNKFYAMKEVFEKNPRQHASTFLYDIKTMREMPKFLRAHLPDHLQLNDEKLNELESKCKKYLSKQEAKIHFG